MVWAVGNVMGVSHLQDRADACAAGPGDPATVHKWFIPATEDIWGGVAVIAIGRCFKLGSLCLEDDQY